MRTFVLILLGVLAAAPAIAAGWKPNCGTVTAGGVEQFTRALSPMAVACLVPTSNTDHGEIISVKGCENVDLGMTEDSDGDGVGGTAFTATLQWCPVNEDDATVDTAGERTAACVDYASGTLTGDGTIQGVGVPSGFLRVEVGGTFAGDPKVWLKCNR